MEGDFKTLFRRFCLESSILGLKYFYIYPDTMSRLFWAITMALILYMACLLTWLLHERFEEMPTRIAIENQYEPVRNLTFPAIIICSPNQITISAMKHFNKTLVVTSAQLKFCPILVLAIRQKVYNYKAFYFLLTIQDREGKRALNLKIILPQLLGFYELVGDLSPRDLENLQNLITLNRYNSLEVMGMLPQSCDDFLKLCFFKGKRYPNCKGLFNPILTKHGMCCAFNSKYHYKKNKRNERIFNFKPETTSKTGLRESLIVVADYNPDDALAGTILNAGAIRLMFTHWTEFPADDESNLVHPNSESFHIIHPTYTYCSEDVMTLPAWSRKCYFEDEYTLPHFRKYHKSDCNLLCHVHELERLCHCTMIYVPNLYLSRACNVTSIDCIVKAKMQINKWYRTEQCDCPRDCVSFRYRVEMVLGNFDALPHIMFNPYSDIVLNKTTTIMQFLVPSPVYVKQKQETVMSLITLSSNLGGVFGLCLGCSTISMLEIYFYIYLFIKNKIKKRLQNALKNKVDLAQ